MVLSQDAITHYVSNILQMVSFSSLGDDPGPKSNTK